MQNNFTVNSARSLAEAHKLLDQHFKECGYTKYQFKHDTPATLPMNALLHVWLTEFAAYLIKCKVEEIDEGAIEDIKRTMKRACYHETGQPWLIYRMTCPLTGSSKVDVTSSAKWSKGEKCFFLDFLQSYAAKKGLILESKGEYKKLKEKQHDT